MSPGTGSRCRWPGSGREHNQPPRAVGPTLSNCLREPRSADSHDPTRVTATRAGHRLSPRPETAVPPCAPESNQSTTPTTNLRACRYRFDQATASVHRLGGCPPVVVSLTGHCIDRCVPVASGRQDSGPSHRPLYRLRQIPRLCVPLTGCVAAVTAARQVVRTVTSCPLSDLSPVLPDSRCIGCLV